MYIGPCDLEAETKWGALKGNRSRALDSRRRKDTFLGGVLGRLPGGDGINRALEM